MSGEICLMNSLLKSNRPTVNDDLIERGQSTYRQSLASILEPSHMGEFVAVEPDSGRYFLGSTASAALVAARAAMPNNLFYLTRVGQETAHTVRAVSRVDYFGVRRLVAALAPMVERESGDKSPHSKTRPNGASSALS
jgi:hypothetical protein